MNNSQKDALGPVFWFCVVWYTFANHSRLSDYAFLSTCAVFIAVRLAILMLGDATARLGMKGWGLVLQFAAWSGLFMYFIPAWPAAKLLVLGGVAAPLMLAGGLLRRLYESFPGLQEGLWHAFCLLGLMALVVQLFVLWNDGFDLWNVLTGTLLFSVLGAVPLEYGWRLAEPFPKSGRDARFGSEESFRDGGMSDER